MKTIPFLVSKRDALSNYLAKPVGGRSCLTCKRMVPESLAVSDAQYVCAKFNRPVDDVRVAQTCNAYIGESVE